MLDRLQLPPTVHHHAHHRVWERRFYHFNVWTDRKIREKLDYLHNNPVERRLVESLLTFFIVPGGLVPLCRMVRATASRRRPCPHQS